MASNSEPVKPLLIRVRAVPNAKKTQVVGVLGDAIKIKVQAVPEGGRANAELIDFLSEMLRVPKRGICVVSGETSREKILKIDGISRSAAEKILQVPLQS